MSSSTDQQTNQPTNPKGLNPNDYALQWCTALMQEPDQCQSGVTYASFKLSDPSVNPKDIASICTASPSNPNVVDTEAFRYGCYLTTAFNDPAQNFCTAKVNMEGKSYSVPYPCKETCNSLFSQTNDVGKCQDAVCQMLENPSSTGGPGVCTPDFNNQYDLLSSARYLPQTFSCNSNYPSAPNVVGCTVAELQASMLGYIQNQNNQS
jgi:hypothetical protein